MGVVVVLDKGISRIRRCGMDGEGLELEMSLLFDKRTSAILHQRGQTLNA